MEGRQTQQQGLGVGPSMWCGPFAQAPRHSGPDTGMETEYVAVSLGSEC